MIMMISTTTTTTTTTPEIITLTHNNINKYINNIFIIRIYW